MAVLSAPSRWRSPVLVLLVAAAAFGTFARTLSFALVWDDIIILKAIGAELHDRGLAGLATMKFPMGGIEGTSTGYYRPLALLSFFVDQQLLSPMPWAHHAINVLLHALASVLLFRFLSLALSSEAGALAGALLFAVHPVHTESVAFVSGRTDLLAAIFVLLPAILWERDRRGLSRLKLAERGLAAISLFFGLLSKEVAVMLPPVLLAWDALSQRAAAPESWWRRNRAWLGVWTLALAAAAFIRWGVAGVGVVGTPPSADSSEAIAGLGLLLNKLLTYFQLLVIPWPLNAYYAPDQIMWRPASLLGGALLACGCALLATRRSARVGAVGFVWIAGFLVPVFGLIALVNTAVVAERYLYLPSAGLSLLAGWIVGRHDVGSRRKLVWPSVAVVTAILAFGSISRSAIWRDEVTLFSQMTRESPGMWHAWYNLGNAYSNAGSHLEAVESYRAAAARKPDQADIYYNLGNAFVALGRHHQAVPEYVRAVTLSPRFADAWYNLGNAYLLLGRGRESREAFEKAAALDLGSTRPGLR